MKRTGSRAAAPWAALLAAALIGAAAGATLYHEPYRMQYHFSPAHTWTNDPNGLVWYKGEFHLFYQNNPFGSVWGHMSWGHAVSPDLLHWRELPVAIPEENGVMIFSGSVVVDSGNSSGLCRSNAGDPSCLVALYTGHTPDLQTQNVAFSNDRGRTWTKYKANPVIDLHMKDFRDPKVIWYAPAKQWVMAVSLPNEHRIRFFGSQNLLKWTSLGEFGPAGATGGQWECPDLFELPDGAHHKWVLVVNINPGGVQGGSAVQYFVGQFDGHTFHNDNPASMTLWADWGKDFYAATSYFNAPPGDANKYWIGWFSNWEYANQEPTAPQRGAMAIPRVLTLRDGRLIQQPVPALEKLRYDEIEGANLDATAINKLLNEKGFGGHEVEMDVVFEANGAGAFGVLVHHRSHEATAIGVYRNNLHIDRGQSGDVAFSPKFASDTTATLPNASEVSLQILLDRSSIEVFADHGRVVMSDRVFPSADSDEIQFYPAQGLARVKSFHAWKLHSVWPEAAQ